MSINRKSEILYFSFVVCLIFSFGFFLPEISAENITLTTYYPSPSGVYDRMRIVPRASLSPTPCDVTTIGLIYYWDGLTGADPFAGATAGFVQCGALGWGGMGGGGSAMWTEDAPNNRIYTTTASRLVGIGTATPQYALHVIDSDDSRTKMFFAAENMGAFRAGQVLGTQWDTLGSASFAAGYNPIASNTPSVAMGNDSQAIG